MRLNSVSFKNGHDYGPLRVQNVTLQKYTNYRYYASYSDRKPFFLFWLQNVWSRQDQLQLPLITFSAYNSKLVYTINTNMMQTGSTNTAI